MPPRGMCALNARWDRGDGWKLYRSADVTPVGSSSDQPLPDTWQMVDRALESLDRATPRVKLLEFLTTFPSKISSA